MTIKIITIGVYLLISFLLLGFVCPMLVSADNSIEVILGFICYVIAMFGIGASAYTAYDLVLHALEAVEVVDNEDKGKKK